MTTSNDKLVFRRIRGRIVPIRSKKSEQSVNKTGLALGAASAGLGVTIANKGGDTYRKLAWKGLNAGFDALDASLSTIPAKDRGTLFEYAAKASSQAKQAANFRKFKAYTNVGKFIEKAAPIAGLGFLGLGVYKAVESIPKKKREKIDPALAASASVVFTSAAPSLYKFSQNAFKAGYQKQGAFSFMKDSLMSSQRIKSWLSSAFKAL